MATKKSTDITTLPSQEALEALKSEFPQEAKANRIILPRLGLVSQDVTEETKNPKTGKKEISIITEAGTFYTEAQTDEVDPETGKNVWAKDEIGTSIKGIIIYQRKQLRYYDNGTQKFTSSPIYDDPNEVVPLFCDGTEVDRGTPAELQKKYPGVTAKGKPKSNLEENKILYVLYEGKPYQMNLRGTSMYAFKDYARKVNPPAVVTSFGSEPKESGSTAWNQMTFAVDRQITAEEATTILAMIRDIKETIAAEKAQYVSNQSVEIVKPTDTF